MAHKKSETRKAKLGNLKKLGQSTNDLIERVRTDRESAEIRFSTEISAKDESLEKMREERDGLVARCAEVENKLFAAETGIFLYISFLTKYIFLYILYIFIYFYMFLYIFIYIFICF